MTNNDTTVCEVKRTMTLRKPGKIVTRNTNAPKGHEAFLKALEASGATVQFEKASNGDLVIGKIKCSDKYTVSVQVPLENDPSKYVTRVLFKHDISEFSTQNRVESLQ